jgi:hypothetical protein
LLTKSTNLSIDASQSRTEHPANRFRKAASGLLAVIVIRSRKSGEAFKYFHLGRVAAAHLRLK